MMVSMTLVQETTTTLTIMKRVVSSVLMILMEKMLRGRKCMFKCYCSLQSVRGEKSMRRMNLMGKVKGGVFFPAWIRFWFSRVIIQQLLIEVGSFLTSSHPVECGFSLSPSDHQFQTRVHLLHSDSEG